MGGNIRLIAVLIIFIGCAACGNVQAPCEVLDVFPNGVELKSGDIIVARSGGFLAAMMSSLGTPREQFGHSGVYFKDENGCGRIIHMQPDGLCVVPLQEFWDNYYHNGIVRLTPDIDIDYVKFDKECHKLVDYDSKKPISAGEWGRALDCGDCNDEGEYPRKLYCITLVNLLYYKAKIPVPFEEKYNISEEPMIGLIFDNPSENDLNVLTIPSVFANDNFKLVSENSSSEREELRGKIDDAMLKAVNKYLAEGYHVKNPSILMRSVICGAYGLKVVAMPIIPAGVKNFLKRISSVRKVNVIYTLNKYVKLVREESMNTILANSGEDAEKVTLEIAEKYKNIGFVLQQ